MQSAFKRPNAKCADYFWLRSTGFAADSIVGLADVSALTNIDVLCGQKQRIEALRGIFLTRAHQVGEQQCRKFLGRLDNDIAPSVTDLPTELRAELSEEIDEWNALKLTIGRLRSELEPEFQAFSEACNQRLIDFLDHPDVAEALFMANEAAEQRIRSLIDDRKGRNDNRKKQKLRLGWNYAQRFCTKNDTCSFFGPIGWGRFQEAQDVLTKVAWEGDAWIADRKTFFESWVVQRLVAQLNAECPLQSGLPLALNPGCYLEGATLYYPLEKSRDLRGTMLGLLQCLTESETVWTGQALAQHLNLTQNTELEHLVLAGIVDRGFQISPRKEEPIQSLIRILEASILPKDFRQKWVDIFHHLEAMRRDYSNGNLEKRKSVLTALNDYLATIGVSLERESGAMYVGRYPFYEDCARASKVTLNGKLKAQLEQDFAPLMLIYQWLTRAVGVSLQQEWHAVWLNCVEGRERKQISLLTFLHALKPEKEAIHERVLARIGAILGSAWEEVFCGSTGDEIELTRQQLDSVLEKLYRLCPEADGFSMFGDSFHSPDFMLSARDLAALNRGEYHVVLGETHPAVHTLSQPVAAPFCPYLDDIQAEVRSLFGGDRLILADSPNSYQRSHIDWPIVPEYQQLVLPSGGGCVPESQRYTIGRAVVTSKYGRMWVTDKGREFHEDILCVCISDVHRLLFNLAGDAVPRRDPRRVRFNKTFFKRRNWSFVVNDMPKSENSDLDMFVSWRNWKSHNAMPRWIFVKCSNEPKPFFVDFDNPLSLDSLENALKRADTIEVSEMLPALDELWFSDTRGRVCSEIRTSFSLKP